MAQTGTTQIIKLGPGETVILPANAQIISTTNFSGGVAESDCTLPPSLGTDTYYFFIDENAAEEDSATFYMEKLVIGGAQTIYPNGFRPAMIDISSDPIFISTTKSNAAVLELRTKNYGGTDNKAFSLTIPKGTPAPYFIVYIVNQSSPWYLRFYPLEISDIHYASTVADLDVTTIR